MDAQDNNVPLEEIEDKYDSDFTPIMHLRNPVTLENLMNKEGQEFELDEDLIQKDFDEHVHESKYDKENVYKEMRSVTMDVEDDDGDDLTPFEALAKKMVKLTDDGGVLKQQLQQGVGDVVAQGQTVFVHYSFYLEYADGPFDCTRLQGKAKKLVLCKEGATECNIIYGLDVAIASMRKAEVSRFLIKPDYAFGALGVKPRVPEDSTIMAEVEVLSFMATGDAGAYLSLSISERNEAPFEMCLQAVVDFRTQGNDLFKQKRYDIASRKYQKAIRLLEEARLADDEDERKQQKELVKNFTNCALCHVKQKEWKRVVTYCNDAIRVDDQHTKGYYLKGKALRYLDDLGSSKVCLLKARQLQPSDSDISKELENLNKRVQRNQIQEKTMCEKMAPVFGGKPDGNPAAKCKDIDSDFEAVLREVLTEFKDSKVNSMPFPSTRHTTMELDCIRKIAKEMNFNVEERREADKFHVKIVKKSESN